METEAGGGPRPHSNDCRSQAGGGERPASATPPWLCPEDGRSRHEADLSGLGASGRASSPSGAWGSPGRVLCRQVPGRNGLHTRARRWVLMNWSSSYRTSPGGGREAGCWPGQWGAQSLSPVVTCLSGRSPGCPVTSILLKEVGAPAVGADKGHGQCRPLAVTAKKTSLPGRGRCWAPRSPRYPPPRSG